MLGSSIHYGNCSSLLEDCEEIRSVLNQKAEMIDRITFDYAMDKLLIIQDYVEVLEGSLAEYSCVSRDMEGYQTGDYKKWETTSYLSDQMLLFSLYYTANQEEILTAKDTLQQVSIEMHLAEEKEKKYNQIGAVKEVSSFGISLIPGLGDAKDLQEAIGGIDLITGKKLSALERVLAGACVIVPIISGSMVRIAGKNANIAEKVSRLSEKQLFKKGAKAGITMCEDAKKEMDLLLREIRNVLEEDVDIKRLFAKSQNTGPQVEFAGVGKVSVGEVEKLVGKDVRWSRGESGSKTISDLSNKAVKHPMNDHMPARYAKQLQYMSKEGAEQYLNYKTFFNSNWTDEQVRAALNFGYKEALNSGVITEKYSFKYLGENVTVYLEDGILKTGYGDYVYTYDELVKLLGGE
ncbi:MAG: pre-toxin TG domain-containing protein [Lachnospiraceae bacterium]|nr:pre-toxin TG domain-containing protein [Lachnospiraceae bacterium]